MSSLLTEGLFHLAGSIVSYLLPEALLQGACDLLARFLRRALS